MQKVTIICLIFIFLLTSCLSSRKTVKQTQESNNSVYSLSDVERNNISKSDFFIQKAEITISDNDISTKFLATVKFKYPDSIMLSIRSKIGYEAARILITKDTVIISDRINKNIIVGRPDDLKKKYGVEHSNMFIILGDFIVMGGYNDVTLNCNNGFFKKEYSIGGRDIVYTIDCSKGKPISAELVGDIKSGNIFLTFSDFIKVKRSVIPRKIGINGDMNKINIEIIVEKIELGYVSSIGFNVPGNYKKIRLK